ncbi:MAG: SpoIIE family protein phosphatase [Clostridia bacterium]
MKSLNWPSKACTFGKYILFFLCFFTLEKAQIYVIGGFGFALLFALCWCNQNPFLLCLMYVPASILANFNLLGAGLAFAPCLIMLLTYAIHLKIKKPMKPILVALYGFLSQIPFLTLKILGGFPIVSTCLTVLFGVTLLLVCIKFLEPIFVRGLSQPLTPLELFCGCSILAICFSGLTSIVLFGFEFVKVVAVFVILSALFSANKSSAILIAGVCGIGTMLPLGNPVYIAPFIIWGFVACAFKQKLRFIPCIAIIATDACLGFAVNAYYFYSYVSLLPLLVGCGIFLFIPQKYIDEFNCFFKNDNRALRSVVNRSRETLCNRLTQLGDAFGEMDTVFRSMIKGGLSEEEANKLLLCEIKDKVCGNCAEFHRCHRTFAEETENVFCEIISSCFQRGKATLLDISPYLTARCTRLNQLVSTINNLSGQFKEYAGAMNSIDASRVLIAEQLCGISKIMKNLAGEVRRNVTFDTNREKKIMDELAFHNIVCSDAVLYEENTNIVSATIVVRDADSLKTRIPTVVSKICGLKMDIIEESPCERAGWKVLSLRNARIYDIAFGTASARKATSKISGDCYSLIRIAGDKFLLALCDGMGSGDKAEKSSQLAISLVENFHKAGFDSEIILSSINKLLSLGKEEIFSALDLCVLDLRKGVGDFIKLGSPPSFIKHEETTIIVESGALPLGILQEAKPCCKKIVLCANDQIVLCTDGISDTFDSEETFVEFVNSIRTLNPQTLAEKILERAIDASAPNGPCDDMTVLVGRIFIK